MVTWFGNMKTMWKLMLGFAVMGVIMCILGWVAAQGLLSVRENLRIVYEDYTVAATDLARTSTSLARYRNRIDLVLAAVDQTAAEKPRVEIPAIKEAMLTSLGAYAATVLRVPRADEMKPKILRRFVRHWTRTFQCPKRSLGSRLSHGKSGLLLRLPS